MPASALLDISNSRQYTDGRVYSFDESSTIDEQDLINITGIPNQHEQPGMNDPMGMTEQLGINDRAELNGHPSMYGQVDVTGGNEMPSIGDTHQIWNQRILRVQVSVLCITDSVLFTTLFDVLGKFIIKYNKKNRFLLPGFLIHNRQYQILDKK